VKIFQANRQVKKDEVSVARMVAMEKRPRSTLEPAEYQKALQREKDVVAADQEKLKALEKQEADAKKAKAEADASTKK